VPAISPAVTERNCQQLSADLLGCEGKDGTNGKQAQQTFAHSVRNTPTITVRFFESFLVLCPLLTNTV
jgi:hypothetical protein